MKKTERDFSTHLKKRHFAGRIFKSICCASTWTGIVVLVVLLVAVLWKAWGWLDWDYLSHYDSRHPENAGILAGFWGSFWLAILTTLFTVPIGVGAAVYLEEFAPNSRLTRFIQVNIANLAGVPSIVYGILGLTFFVRMFDLFQGDQDKEIEIFLILTSVKIPLPLGRTLVAGALTLSLLILPVVIVAAQEALKAVPSSLQNASLALGATRWQTVKHHIIPSAAPGILTGIILSISRAIGETAPLVMIGALTYVAFSPGDIESPVQLVTNPQGIAKAPFDTFTAMPLQIYNWVSRPKEEYRHVAAAGIVLMLVFLLAMNATAIFLRHHFKKKLQL